MNEYTTLTDVFNLNTILSYLAYGFSSVIVPLIPLAIPTVCVIALSNRLLGKRR
jgi:hypothetical protein